MRFIMKLRQAMPLISLSAPLAATPVQAQEWVRLDASKAPQSWQITS
jgi:hypothetical protein